MMVKVTMIIDSLLEAEEVKSKLPPFISSAAQRLNIDEYISLHSGEKKGKRKISSTRKVGNLVINKAFLTIPRISNGQSFPICYSVCENFVRVYSYKEKSISMDIELYAALIDLKISHICYYIRNTREHLFIEVEKFNRVTQLNTKIGPKRRCTYDPKIMLLKKNRSIKLNKMIKMLSVNIKPTSWVYKQN